jgi:N utilization substance protein B
VTGSDVKRGGPDRQASARHGARAAALQMLYQWEIGGAPIDRTIEMYWAVRESEIAEGEENVAAAPVDRDFAERLARGTAAHVAALDPTIEAATENWRLSRIAVVDRLILRLAAYELHHDPGTPAAVVINEALELARTFSGADAVRFVNGVLDAVAKAVRGDV